MGHRGGRFVTTAAPRWHSVVIIIADAWHWWREGLVACVPRSLVRYLHAQRDALEFDIEDGEPVRLYERSDPGNVLWSATEPDADAALVRLITRRRDKRRKRLTVSLRIERDQTLQKMIKLPEAASENLGEVVGFEVQRHTPFRTEHVYYGYELVNRDPAKRKLSVKLEVVPRVRLDPVISRLTALDVDVMAVRAEPEGVAIPVADPSSARAQIPRSGRWSTALIALLFIAVIVTPFELMQSNLDTVRQDNSRLAREIARLSAIHSTDAVSDLHRQVVAERHAEYRPKIVILDALTAALGDHTFVTQLEIEDGRIKLFGESLEPGRALEDIERAPLFTSSALRSTTPSPSDAERQRFEIVTIVAAANE